MKTNKNILGVFGSQIDMLNTLGGGISMTSMDVTKTPHNLLITLRTPSLDGEAYTIEVNQNQLVVYSVINNRPL